MLISKAQKSLSLWLGPLRNQVRAAFVLLMSGAAVCWGETPLPGYTAGTPWSGQAGIRETTAQIMVRERAQPKSQILRVMPLRRRKAVAKTLEALPNVLSGSRLPAGTSGPLMAQTFGINFTGATLADCSGYPPDTMGAVGPSQFIIALNGRIRSFNKAKGVVDDMINVGTDAFFSSVMTPPANNNFTSDPRIRYDRLSGRWFIIMIDVPGQSGTLPNRVMLAVSDSDTITSGTVWTFFQFEHDLVSPAGDTGDFADYPTLGIDANALYIGINVFSSAGSFVNTTAFVVRKSSLLSGGPIVVTAFRDLIITTGPGPFATQTGPYTPQGVDNFDPTATEGYFIGIDASSVSELQLRRVSDPGGTPSISTNVTIPVNTWASPINVRHLGNTGGTANYLDCVDERLMAAHYRDGLLWTSHSVGVNNTGGSSSITRDGVRWYAIQNIPTGGSPSVQQSGTVYQPSASNTTDQRSYWMGTIMVSGQGHAAMGFSSAGQNEHANAAACGRLVGDVAGTMQTPALYTTSTSAYNAPYNRWGDFSYTSLDPSDDMTMWTIQEWCSSANTYAVQILKLIAPPPATPTNCNPALLAAGATNMNLIITASSNGGAGFFDPGSGFSNRIAAAVDGGGVTVNSITYNNSTNVTLNISVDGGAAGGERTITITNPDGQSVTSSNLLTIIGSTNIPPVLAFISDRTIHERTTLTFTNAATDANGDALTYNLDPGAPAGAEINSTNGIFTWTPDNSYINTTTNITIRVTDDGVPPLSDAKTFAVTVMPPPTFQAVSASNDVLTISWSAISGQTYRLQYQTNLADPGWIDLPPDITATNAIATATDSIQPDDVSRFYRVLVIP